MATLVTDLGLSLQSARQPSVRSQGREVLQWSLLGAGAVTGIVGIILLQTAGGRLMDAVAQHNNTQMDQVIDQSMQMRPMVGVGTDGHGGSVSMTMPF